LIVSLIWTNSIHNIFIHSKLFVIDNNILIQIVKILSQMQNISDNVEIEYCE